MNDEKKTIWLTPEEAADYLKIHVSTIYRYISDEAHPLPSYKISRNNIRISKEELDKWVKENE